MEIAKRTGNEGKSAMPFLNPSAWPYALRHAGSPHRDENRAGPEALTVECVEISGERIFVVLFEPQNTKAFMTAWQNCGLGISTRHAEKLLEGVDGLKRLEGVGLGNVPEPTWTAEGEVHGKLKERIVELVKRAPIDPAKVKCETKDVFLYPSGMAALWYMATWISEIKPGAAVVLGIPFHNTYHHLLEEAKGGMVNFGGVDETGLDKFESWLEEDGGKEISWVYAEFPGNPTLETPDLGRLQKLVSLPSTSPSKT
ncbi:aminotransferase class I and II domain-containing protein [Sarocladium implicatum]|nr:aminotransferase class I and II domain-containing protein [Sarocladium implicatum]